MSDLIPVDLQECKDALAACGIPPAQALAVYMQLLLEKNQRTNLTGAKSPHELAVKHIADVWYALNALGRPATQVVDVGTGGGIPGIVLAIVSPQTEVILVERRQKKAAALQEMVKELGLETRVKVVPRSFEEVKRLHSDYEYWFRGVLPGPKLAAYLSQYFPHADLGQLVLMKGPAWPQEKLDIMGQQKVKDVWKERFASAAEINYSLPEGAGERILVLV